MNVVGKVGSLITQGVYSVATPFHPFGGAVDIIVVQQQDGSFRSTPWYVQFGKFQGVLKGAEKIVRINVNGVETNFHMYLDNSGEAYFVREVNVGDDSEKNGVSKDEGEGTVNRVSSEKISSVSKESVEVYRLQSTKSDPGVIREDYSSLRPERLERMDSDACRFYDFQDDQSFDDSVELSSEYGSSRYENLDVGENFVEEQGTDSEMVLVSVDGHILMAPISSSEQSPENVQLATPQFHLGPGEGHGFCGEDGEFSVSETSWTAGYLNNIDASSPVNPGCVGKNTNSLEEQSEVCKDGKHGYTNQVTDNVYQSKVQKEDDVHANRHEHTDEVYQVEACKEDEKHVNKGIGDVHEAEALEGGQGYIYQDQETRDTHELEHVEQNQEAREIHQHENSEVDSKGVCNDQADSISDRGVECCVCNDVMDSPNSLKNDDVFSSCLDLTKVAIEKETKAKDSSMGVQEEGKDIEEKPLQSFKASNDYETESSQEKFPTDVRAIDTATNEVKRDSMSSHEALDSLKLVSSHAALRKEIQTDEQIATSVDVNKSQDKDEHVGLHSNNDAVERSPESDTSEATCSRSEVVDPGAMSFREEMQAISSSRLEISLCRHLLLPGMGLSAADEAFNAHRISQEEFQCSSASVVKNENLVIRFGERYLSWDKAAPFVLGMAAFGSDLPIDPKDAIPVQEEAKPKLGEDSRSPSASRRWRLWPIPFRRVKTLERSSSTASIDEVFVDPESVSQSPSSEANPTSQNNTPKSETVLKSPRKKIIRTNIPTSEQIASLNLKEGQNNVTFSFSTRVLGLQQVEAHIYLWRWNAQIVISDVDGTITKSDVLGQFMPLVGKDWSQFGVAQLFSAIKENGYHLLFLSARAIVQAYLTKSFLFNLKQDGKRLPTGPVVISPNGLFPSLFREVIRRAPHEFKIACLEDIKALFPPDYNPFYAGFGNRDTDELTYRKIGIPKGKIFIINPKGEVAINHRIDVKSYTSLHTLVDDMFPPTSMVQQEDYNSWNYWKMPLPDIND